MPYPYPEVFSAARAKLCAPNSDGAEAAAGLGLGVGISSGANFIGALMMQDEMGGDAVVTTVFPDDNKKYLTTDLLRDERAQPD